MRSSFLSFSKVKLLCYQSTKEKLINCLIHREMAKMAVFGVWDGSATAFSLFHIVHTYDSHHTKGKPRNSLMKAPLLSLNNRGKWLNLMETMGKILLNYLRNQGE